MVPDLVEGRLFEERLVPFLLESVGPVFQLCVAGKEKLFVSRFEKQDQAGVVEHVVQDADHVEKLLAAERAPPADQPPGILRRPLGYPGGGAVEERAKTSGDRVGGLEELPEFVGVAGALFLDLRPLLQRRGAQNVDLDAGQLEL